MEACGDGCGRIAGKHRRIILTCLGLVLIGCVIPTVAADPWYEKLHSETRAAFEQHAGDYVSVNGYLWSQATLRAISQYTQRTNQSFHDVKDKVKSTPPLYYDPKTKQIASSLIDITAGTPGIDRIIGVVEAISQEGILIALEDRSKALLVDHSLNVDKINRGHDMRITAIPVAFKPASDHTGFDPAIPRYKMVVPRTKVSAEELARYFYDNGITEFVRFSPQKITGPRAKNRRYVRVYKQSARHRRRRKTCPPLVYRATPSPQYEWQVKRIPVPKFQPRPPD